MYYNDDYDLRRANYDRRRAEAASRERRIRRKRLISLFVCEACLAIALALIVMLQMTSHATKATAEEWEPTATAVGAEGSAEKGGAQSAAKNSSSKPACASTSASSTATGAAHDGATSVSDANGDWSLVLVNAAHAFTAQPPQLAQVGNAKVDARCADALERMFDAARAAGLYPDVNSSYRSKAEQQKILDGVISEKLDEGLSAEEAHAYAQGYVAAPGHSEHETGLAVDLTSECRDGGEMDMAVHEWMAEHSWEYGWILRYPADKVAITGINNEPWHYRYVGPDAAREIYQQGVCLEEYLGAA